MQSLLNPETRGNKVTRLDRDIVLEVGPRLWDGKDEKKILGFTLTVPKGTPAASLGNFQHKPFLVDLISSKVKPEELKKRLTQRVGAEKAEKISTELRVILSEAVDERGANFLRPLRIDAMTMSFYPHKHGRGNFDMGSMCERGIEKQS